MARLRFYHDKRKPLDDGKCPVTVSVSHCGTSALIPTGVSVKPEHWHPGDKETEPHIKKTCTGYRVLNNAIGAVHGRVQEELMKLIEDNSILPFKNATTLKNYINDKLKGAENTSFTEYFQKFIEKIKTESTAATYQYTYGKIQEFSAGKTLWFEDITRQWLEVFDRSLSDLAVNTRGIHMRNIRAVFNAAIDNEITTAPYPFRRFKIKKQETIKRSIPAEDIRKLYEFECEPHQRIYVDMFILLFLFRGMNIKDLSHLKEEDVIQDEQGCFVFLIYTVFSANYFNLDVHGFRVIWQRIIPSSPTSLW